MLIKYLSTVFNFRKVDKFITEILGNRVEECFIREGNLDGHSKCRQLKEEHEIAMTNYYVKCKKKLI